MITPTIAPTRDDVAGHYDELDRFYREVWGEHVHHGLWDSKARKATPEQAARRLIAVVAEQARVRPGDAVCDIGCGYGGTARVLAREHRAEVTALTISPAQHAHAIAIARDGDNGPDVPNPTYLLRDWLENDLPAGSFDAAVAIESTEHMGDLSAFFHEAARVLKPGGRLVVCAWLSREAPRAWEARHFLEPICREGRLARMGTAADYERLARKEGLEPSDFRDVSRQVKKTWTICARRVAAGLVRDPSYRAFLRRGKGKNRVFALTLLRIRLAYELGSMRYGILTFVKGRDNKIGEATKDP